MFTAIAIGFLFVAVIIHEAGHFVAMRHYKVGIEAAGIGFGPSLRIHVKRLGVPLTFSPLLLGAYVKPTEEGFAQMQQLPARKQAVIYAAGPLMNFAATGAILISLIAYRLFDGNTDKLIARSIALGVIVMLAIACYRWLEFVSAYVLPIIGLLHLILLAVVLATNPSGGVDGPIGIVEVATSATLFDAVLFGLVINLGLGWINLMPCLPLDGGRILSAILQEKTSAIVADRFGVATGLAFAVFAVYVITNDILSLF